MNFQENPLDSFHLTLIMFVLMNLWMTALAATIPVPLGMFRYKVKAIYNYKLASAVVRLLNRSLTVNTTVSHDAYTTPRFA